MNQRTYGAYDDGVAVRKESHHTVRTKSHHQISKIIQSGEAYARF